MQAKHSHGSHLKVLKSYCCLSSGVCTPDKHTACVRVCNENETRTKGRRRRKVFWGPISPHLALGIRLEKLYPVVMPVSPESGPGVSCSKTTGCVASLSWNGGVRFWGRGFLRSPGSPLSGAYLEDGVISVLAGAVPSGMAPGDGEEFPFAIDPLEPWVLAAVHLGHQPGLQPYAAGRRGDPQGRLVHGKGVCRRKTEGRISSCAAGYSFGRGAWGGGDSRGPATALGLSLPPSTGGWSLSSPSSCSKPVPFPTISFLVTGPCTCAVFGGREGGGDAVVDVPPRCPLPDRASLPQLSGGWHSRRLRAAHLGTCPPWLTPGWRSSPREAVVASE